MEETDSPKAWKHTEIVCFIFLLDYIGSFPVTSFSILTTILSFSHHPAGVWESCDITRALCEPLSVTQGSTQHWMSDRHFLSV